jgi:uncharacterized protein YdeI (YjbR/CyaY-like superfamily)
VTAAADGLPVMAFESRAEFAGWLAREHAASAGIWLAIAKKGSGRPTISYAEAVEVALCHGWIDGQKRPLDDAAWLQRFIPRRKGSRWSKINRDKALELVERGEMRPAGLREIELAQADGRWDAAYASQRTITVPDDLQAALGADPGARAFFETLDGANRYAVLYRVHEAKRPETRARRIRTLVAMLAEHRTIHPLRPTPSGRKTAGT